MIKIDNPQALDTFSAKLVPVSDGMLEYQKPCDNGCFISTGSLEGILLYLSKVTFSLFSPIIPEDNVSNNVERLASFRELIQSAEFSLYHIVGQWHVEDSDSYLIHKGFVLVKPNHMTTEGFSDFIRQALKNYDQEAFVIKSPDEDLLCVDREGKVMQRYSGNLSLNLLAKAYAYGFSMEGRFTFAGLEIPNGSISSFQLFKGSKVGYYLPEDFF